MRKGFGNTNERLELNVIILLFFPSNRFIYKSFVPTDRKGKAGGELCMVKGLNA
jgi:hypothetical protein